MPDKKLTDNEIVKEFQLRTLKAEHPGFILCGQIVDLINRQQAEIERLEKGWKADILLTQNTKAEAYKECIEKVKAEINKHSYGVLHKTVINFKLDNLLKEMVGDNQ